MTAAYFIFISIVILAYCFWYSNTVMSRRGRDEY